MSSGDHPEDVERVPHDPAVVAAAADLEAFFGEHPKEVFYERQILVRFEKTYFHWITARALRQLAEAGKLSTALEELPGATDEGGVPLMLRFYRHAGHRYWRTQRKEIVGLVSRFAGAFGHALGHHGELLCDAALGGEGFVRAAKNVREWNGKRWEETEHNLDRVYVRDGVAYGCEIKNTLKYFPVDERKIKQAMCRHLGLKPLFIVRWLPKSHMHEIIQAGGFGILFERQLYPLGHEALAREVRERLGFPVECSRELPPDAVARFLKLHAKFVGSRDGVVGV